MNPQRFALHLQTYTGILPDEVIAEAERLGTTDEKRHEISAYLEEQAQKYADFHTSRKRAEKNMALISENLKRR